jgi:hypothetical protein
VHKIFLIYPYKQKYSKLKAGDFAAMQLAVVGKGSLQNIK